MMMGGEKEGGHSEEEFVEGGDGWGDRIELSTIAGAAHSSSEGGVRPRSSSPNGAGSAQRVVEGECVGVVRSKSLIGAGSAQRVVEGECIGEVRAAGAARASIVLTSAKHSAIISESPGSLGGGD